MSQKEEFVAFLCRSIAEIPQDVKILFEMLDDGELNDVTRVRAAGSLLYLLAPGDLVPDTFGLLGHVDDSLVMRLAMDVSLKQQPERADHYKQRYPEVFDPMEQDFAVCEAYLGDVLFAWIGTWLDKLSTIEFKGKKAPGFLDDVEEGSWLYDEVNEALLEFEADDDDLLRDLRKVDKIIPVMQQKMDAAKR